MLVISLFDGIYDNVPKIHRLTWEDLITSLPPSNPNEHAMKDACPLFCGVEFRTGEKRAVATALRAHFLTLDFDGAEHRGMTQEEVAGVMQVLSGMSAFLYTTWSHYVTPTKMRAIVRLSHPVEACDWNATISRVYSLFPCPPDPACKDIAHMYYPPFAPTPHAPFYHTTHGAPLDVDALLALPHPGSAKPRGVSLVRLTSLAGRLKRDKPDLAKALLEVARGGVFAEEHARDETIFRMARYLAEEWPDENPDNVAGLFGRSLETMSRLAANCPTLKDVAYKVRRAQEQLASEVTYEETAARADRAARLAEMGRSTPYSEEELDAICDEQGITRDTLRKRWLIQRDRGVYVLRPGGYVGPFSLTEVHTAVLRDLAPASSAGVDLHEKSSRGKVTRKTWPKLIETYGTVAEDVRIDLMSKRTVYMGGTLIEGCPRPNIPPVHHEAVHRWLAHMGGHPLLSWIAALTRLDDCITALFLIGPKGTGKSLLVHGLARTWGTQPTPLEHGMSKFPDRIAKCPLLFGDETLPKDIRGFSRSGELRQLVQSRERLIERKFMAPIPANGAVRIVVAANNASILGFNEDLTEDDVGAIADRILYIRPPKDTAEYIPTTETRMWVERGIAEHAAWLAKNYAWRPVGRFLIPTNSQDMIKHIASLSGARAGIIQWIVSWLLDPRRLVGQGGVYATIKGGKIYIAQSTILRYWSTYMPTRTPNVRAVAEVLSSIGVENATLTFGSGKAQVREIAWEHIVSWLEATEYCSVAEVQERLAPAPKPTLVREAN